MTSYLKDDYLGNNDPNNLLNGYSRIVDVAVLDSEEITAPKEIDAHVISLDAIDITWDKFLNLFYHVDNNTFQINKAMAEDPDMTFVGQTIHTNNFHLLDSVLRLYGLDLGVELDCLDPCSSLEITQQILYYKSLANMYSVKCALTVNEIIETIVNRTESKFMEGSAGEHKYHKVFGYAEAPVYHQLVIQARFYNSNKMVKDIYVKFRFNVCFKGENMIKNIIQSIVRPSFFPDEQEEEAIFSGDTSGSGPGSPPITGTLNAIDVNGPVTYSIYGSGTTDNGGTYSIDGSGNWSYTPQPDFFGTDSFVVISKDTQEGTSEQKITVNVEPTYSLHYTNVKLQIFSFIDETTSPYNITSNELIYTGLNNIYIINKAISWQTLTASYNTIGTGIVEAAVLTSSEASSLFLDTTSRYYINPDSLVESSIDRNSSGKRVWIGNIDSSNTVDGNTLPSELWGNGEPNFNDEKNIELVYSSNRWTANDINLTARRNYCVLIRYPVN